MSSLSDRLRAYGNEQVRTPTVVFEAADELDRLGAMLVQANDAFDECTGEYPKELVDGEPWRQYRPEELSTFLRDCEGDHG